MTYVSTDQSWTYLSTALDLATRAVVGWSLQGAPTSAGPIAALRMARAQERFADGDIFHSDHRTQCTSHALGACCTEQGVQQAMGRMGAATTTRWRRRSSPH
jgi:transposase InsO family protein